MYSAKIVTNSGKSLFFGYEYGILFDIEPLIGMDVSIKTSQGLNQIGVTVEGSTISSIKRTIRGILLDKITAKKMEKAITPFTSGKLYVNDAYFCEFVVNKVPNIKTEKNGKITFTMQVLCPVPFWSGAALQYYSISNGSTKDFSFPVQYNSHKFGTQVSASNTNVENIGDVNASFICVFHANSDVVNYGIVNTLTSQKLQFKDTLQKNERVTVSKENGRLKAIKESASGNISEIIGFLTDDSYLFEMNVGDNFIETIADINDSYLNATISFYPQYTGVIV